MSEKIIKKSIYLKATPEKVWAYLTDPDKLAIWFHRPDAPLLGGDYTAYGTETGDKLMWGRVLVAEPFKRLEYTFTIAPMGDTESTVKWTIEEVEGGSRLSLRHEGLPQNADAFGLLLALDKGWDDHIARMRSDAHG